MAEGTPQTQVIHVQGDLINTTSVVEGQIIVKKQKFGDSTHIHGSKIGTVNAGTSGQVLGQQRDEQRNLVSSTSSALSAELHKTADLTENASRLTSNLDYQAAIPLLREAEARSFVRKLILVECYIYTDEDVKGTEIIDDIRNSLITPTSPPTADEVKDLASHMMEDFLFTRAIILLRIVSDMYKNDLSSPDDKIKGLSYCLVKIGEAIMELVKKDDNQSRKIATKYGLEYMKENLEDLRSVKNVCPKLRTLKEAGCLDWYASCYFTQNGKMSLKLRQEAVGIVEKQFGSSACENKIYGLLFHNIGAVLYLLGNKKEAVPYLQKALKATEKALDYETAKEKQELIVWSKARLLLAQASGDETAEFEQEYRPYV